MGTEVVTVILDQNEAEKFILFQKHFDTFNILIESKVFDQKAATVTIFIDKYGHIKSIERKDLLYLHGTPFDNVNKVVLL